jgi:CHAD domain-containing protein
VSSIDVEQVRALAHAISQSPGSGTDEENWLRAERELTVAHDYDTPDGDLERTGVRVSRLPLEAGVVWRLTLPRGERVEAWSDGTDGLTLPAEIAGLVGGIVAGKELVPSPPLSDDPGARRLREVLEAQRHELLVHDPGARLGEDPENLHKHRVAARRARALLRAARRYVDREWRQSLTLLLAELGAVTGPVRDLDVLLDDVREEVERLDEADRAGGETLVARLVEERGTVREQLLATLDGDRYQTLLGRLRLPPRLAEGVDRVPIERIARKEFRRLERAVDRLGAHPDDAALHRLRIVVKRVRYTAELSAPEGKARRRFLADATTLQNLLGAHQDALVAEEHLRRTAVIDQPTATAFAAGRLAERRAIRRARTTHELHAAWKRVRKSGARLG